MNTRQYRPVASTILSVACVLLVATVLLGGCAASVQRVENAEKRRAYFEGGGKLAKEVTVSLNPQAQQELKDNARFDQQRLLQAIKRKLDAKGLLAKTPDAELPTIEVMVTGVRLRSAFSAVMFGFMAGDDHIYGEVVARDKSGRELQRFGVSASYAFGGLVGGQDGVRMDWLYDAFAQETVRELTGQRSAQQ